jgi:hypothetical protein
VIYSEHVEEFKHTDLSILDLAEHWEGKNAYHGYHSDRYEADQIDVEL